jgi:hypothetical protein
MAFDPISAPLHTIPGGYAKFLRWAPGTSHSNSISF